MGEDKEGGRNLIKGFLHLKDKVPKCSYLQGKGHLNVPYLYNYKENTLPSPYRGLKDKGRKVVCHKDLIG